MKFYTDESSVFSTVTIPDHLCGWSNLIHGGVLSTILDEIMGWAALYLLKRIILTKSMTVEFLKPVHMGGVLEAESKVLEIDGKHSVMMEGVILDVEGEVCAKSRGQYAVFTSAVAKRLRIADDQQLKWFDRIHAC